MKITIYTISDCQFCKAEKDYFNMKGLPFEEKNLETNKAYLTEMLDLSDKFAGVPFTVINKDDGSVVKLKGFTAEEFDAALATNSTSSQSQMPVDSNKLDMPMPVVDQMPKVTDTLPTMNTAPQMQMNSDNLSTNPASVGQVPVMPSTSANVPTNLNMAPAIPMNIPAMDMSSMMPNTLPSDIPSMPNMPPAMPMNTVSNSNMPMPQMGNADPIANTNAAMSDMSPAAQLDALLASLKNQTQPSANQPMSSASAVVANGDVVSS